MAEFPIMPVGTSDFLADTMHLSHEEMGLYWRMCLNMWRAPERRFPNDDGWLAKRFNADAAAVRALVSEFFQCDGNWITHKRIEKEYQFVSASSRKQSARAKSRWKKKTDECRGNADTHASGIAPIPIPIPIDNSVAKATGAVAPPAGESGFSKMARWFVLNANLKEGPARSYLGEMRKLHGNDAVDAAFLELRAISPPPSDPRAYFRAMLEGNHHGSDAKAEAPGSEGRIDRVVERLRARSEQGFPERPGRDDDPVLPAVQGVH